VSQPQGEIIFKPLPGNVSSITGGGTRNKLQLKRPWQGSLGDLVRPAVCPFCTKIEPGVPVERIPDGIRMLENPFTPHRQHKLIIPRACMREDQLRRLGGQEVIRAIFDTAALAIAQGIFHGGELAFFAHIGRTAGQNQGHLHWHCKETLPKTPFTRPTNIDPEVVVFRSNGFTVAAMGAHAGECFVMPNRDLEFQRSTVRGDLAIILSQLIDLGNKKFVSEEGRTPDFMLTVRVSARGIFRYANYLPILTMWGGTEHVLAVVEGAPFTLPWTHELTAQHLREP
jgi:hypothetical protein